VKDRVAFFAQTRFETLRVDRRAFLPRGTRVM
jgi:hypothetical protein